MVLSRRGVLSDFGLAAVCVAAAKTHTPYEQWVVYRQKHLLIGAHRGGGRTYELAHAIVLALDLELPAARARITLGPRPQRIASLMGTGQLMMTVLPADEADLMAEAKPPFECYQPTPLCSVAHLRGGYFLFAGPDFPDDHAWFVAQALGDAAMGQTPTAGSLEWHPGSAALWSGARLPVRQRFGRVSEWLECRRQGGGAMFRWPPGRVRWTHLPTQGGIPLCILCSTFAAWARCEESIQGHVCSASAPTDVINRERRIELTCFFDRLTLQHDRLAWTFEPEAT